jgi:von Willebrand factor type A domain
MLESGPYTGSMSPRAVFLGIVIVAGAAAATSTHVGAQSRERSMYVSMLNEAGAPVEGLGASDFVVREDNVVREVLRVVPADEPMQVEILVDNSQAARDYIRDMRAALPGFVDALTESNEGGRRNEVGLVALAERPTILAEPTFDRTQLHKGIDRIFAQSGSGSYLLDSIIDVSKGFKKREAQRPVIVVITTEGPEFSSRHFDLVLTPLREASAALHAIVIGPLSTDMSDDAHNRNIVLDQGPRDSGGRFDHLLTSMALGGKLSQLAAELTHQYKVTFARPESLIPPEHTTVTAARPGLTARGTLIKEPQTRP